MRTRILTFFLFLLPFASSGQTEKKFFKGEFRNQEHRISLHLDLYEMSLEAPDLSFLGRLNGYMKGQGVYGTWLITQHAIKGKTAIIRMSNDTGSDSQTIELRQLSDSTLSYQAVEGNNIRKAVGRKLVKIVSEMILTKQKH